MEGIHLKDLWSSLSTISTGLSLGHYYSVDFVALALLAPDLFGRNLRAIPVTQPGPILKLSAAAQTKPRQCNFEHAAL